MQFDNEFVTGTLIKRYKRFLADVSLDDGTVLTAHTPNTGSMKGCAEPGSRVWLRDTRDEKRKYRFSWEMVQTPQGVTVGINTGLSNRLVEEAIANGTLSELQGYGRIRREVKYGNQNSRIDLLLEQHPEFADCYVEVKNVTLVEHEIAYFPDAVSERGKKHLQELADVAQSGGRGALVFCVQREDAREVRPADDIDPAYGQELRRAMALGVTVLAYQARVSAGEIRLYQSLPVCCP